MRLDRLRRQAHRGNYRNIALSPLETEVLALLMIHADRLCPYPDFFDHMPGWGKKNMDALHTAISRLRAKVDTGHDTRIAKSDATPLLSAAILTIHGKGYMLVSR